MPWLFFKETPVVLFVLPWVCFLALLVFSMILNLFVWSGRLTVLFYLQINVSSESGLNPTDKTNGPESGNKKGRHSRHVDCFFTIALIPLRSMTVQSSIFQNSLFWYDLSRILFQVPSCTDAAYLSMFIIIMNYQCQPCLLCYWPLVLLLHVLYFLSYCSVPFWKESK